MYATSAQITEALNAYTANGQVDYVEDANGNRSDYVYDGLDRVCRLYFPQRGMGGHLVNTGTAALPVSCASATTTGDFESYAYDPNGNVTSFRPRSGDSDAIGFSYDALNRVTLKNAPGGTSGDVYSGYDLLSRQTYARFVSAGGTGDEFSYDALSRVITQKDTAASPNRTLTSAYDLAGHRTRLTYPDSAYVDYTYDGLGRMLQVRENGATSGAGLLAVYAYDNKLRPSSLTRGNAASTTFSYTTGSQNWSLTQSFPTSSNNLTLAFTANAAGQTLTRTPTSSVAGYKYAPPSAGASSYGRNGLNQITSVAAASFSSDARGNLTSDGSRSFGYDVENRLTSVSGGASMTVGPSFVCTRRF